MSGRLPERIVIARVELPQSGALTEPEDNTPLVSSQRSGIATDTPSEFKVTVDMGDQRTIFERVRDALGDASQTLVYLGNSLERATRPQIQSITLSEETKPATLSIVTSADRNMGLRARFAPLIESIAGKIHELFPDLTPNMLTLISTVGVATGAGLALVSNREELSKGVKNIAKGMAIGTIIPASFADAIDGTLQRLIEKENPERKNPLGHIIDATSDRTQEFLLTLSRMFNAYLKGDKIGMMLATGAAISNNLPSVSRAIAEDRNKIVAEGGKNTLGFFGTRVGRAALGIPATLYPEIKGISVQKIADSIVIASNLAATIERLTQTQETNGSQNQAPPEIQKRAGQRLLYLGATAIGISAISLATYCVLSKNMDRRNN